MKISKMIPVANVLVEEEDAKAVYDVVRSGWISMGKQVQAFEKEFSAITRSRSAIAVNSGTAALHAILAGLGIKPGEEVILPSLTFISTANVVLYQGATPVLVECDPKTFNVTSDAIEQAITNKTRAIIAVDMNGMPVDYDAILSLGEKYSLPVIADSAESLGASYRGKAVGGIAPIHAFSFFPNKTVTTGEGGMITTSDAELEERLRQIINQGQDGRYHHVRLGYNYRMTDICAALGRTQLERMDRFIQYKEEIVKFYMQALDGIEGIELPYAPDYVTRQSWYMFAIKVNTAIRDRVVSYLKKNDIDTRLSFPPIHIQPFYQKEFGYTNESLPITYRTWRRLINLPIWPGLTQGQLDHICNCMIEAVRKNSNHRDSTC